MIAAGNEIDSFGRHLLGNKGNSDGPQPEVTPAKLGSDFLRSSVPVPRLAPGSQRTPDRWGTGDEFARLGQWAGLLGRPIMTRLVLFV